MNAPRRPQSRVQTAPYFSRVLLFKRKSCARKNVANISRKCQTFVETFALIARYHCCTPVWTSFVSTIPVNCPDVDRRRLCIFHVNFSSKCSEGEIYAHSLGMCISLYVISCIVNIIFVMFHFLIALKMHFLNLHHKFLHQIILSTILSVRAMSIYV